MTENKILFWSLVFASVYWITGVMWPSYHSTISSAALLVFGAVALSRYGPEAWKIVVQRHRLPKHEGGAHLAAYGVALLSAGSVYVGLFGVLWVWNGQPDNWLATPISGFGRFMMAAGFCLLFFSPDMEKQRLKLPSQIWLIVAGIVALLLAFALGLKLGGQEERSALIVHTCPVEMTIKGSRNGVYHSPGDKYYDRTNPVACFRSRQTATLFGYRERGEKVFLDN